MVFAISKPQSNHTIFYLDSLPVIIHSELFFQDAMDSNTLHKRLCTIVNSNDLPRIPKGADLKKVDTLLTMVENLGREANMAEAMGLSTIVALADESARQGIMMLVEYFVELDKPLTGDSSNLN
jgi:hypothetical protein